MGSMLIVVLTGFFTGAVMALQLARAWRSGGNRDRWALRWRSRWFANWGRC